MHSKRRILFYSSIVLGVVFLLWLGYTLVSNCQCFGSETETMYVPPLPQIVSNTVPPEPESVGTQLNTDYFTVKGEYINNDLGFAITIPDHWPETHVWESYHGNAQYKDWVVFSFGGYSNYEKIFSIQRLATVDWKEWEALDEPMPMSIARNEDYVFTVVASRYSEHLNGQDVQDLFLDGTIPFRLLDN